VIVVVEVDLESETARGSARDRVVIFCDVE
jgi:hypothetical protein